MKALITGASSGIGKEIARYLAELGYDLILVSRSTDKLNKLKEELSNVNVRVITLDFSRESDSLDLYEHIKNENEQIDFLVNNAGFGAYGKFLDVPLESLNSFTPMFQRFTFSQSFFLKIWRRETADIFSM